MSLPKTWGTTATLTARVLSLVPQLTGIGIVAVVALAGIGAPPEYASAVGVIVAASLAAVGLGGGAGAYGHASQYQRHGSPTSRTPIGAPVAPQDLP